MILHMTHLLNHSTSTKSGPCTHAQPSLLADAARRGVPCSRRRDSRVQRAGGPAGVGAPAAQLSRRDAALPVRITIADNASIDDTPRIAARLADELDGVRAGQAEQKGRGRAVNAVWSSSDAPVLAYMDIDLSTDLAALVPLVAPLISGHSDLAIGTRLARTSRVVRGPKREVISRCYNMILKATMSARFSDAQCGFKAIRADVARRLLPLVADTGWFFDTELLVLAERAGLRIHEVPVDWVDDPDSRVDIVATATADLKGIARMRTGFALGRIPLEEVAAQLGTNQAAPSARRRSSAGPVRDHRRPQHPGLSGDLHRAVGGRGFAGRQLPRPADHGDRQHRSQPAVHLRHSWAVWPGPSSRRGPVGLRHGVADFQWLAGQCPRAGSPHPLMA